MNLISIQKAVVLHVFRRISFLKHDAIAVIEVYNQRQYQLIDVHLQEGQMERWIASGLVSAQLPRQELLTLPEFAWLRFLNEAERKEIPVSHLRALQTCPKLIDRMVHLMVRTGLFSSIAQKAFSKEEFTGFKSDSEKPLVFGKQLKAALPGLNLFSSFVCFAAVYKQAISIVMDSNGKFEVFCAHLMSEIDLSSSELTRVLSTGHIGISINELINVSIAEPPEITALSTSETTLIELVRSDRNITDIAIRMKEDGKMGLLKFTRMQVLNDLTDIERMVKKSGHHDIQFSVGNGKVLSCFKTTKIKFN